MAGQNTYLIVGLGNIGIEYRYTRHNIGFLVLDALAEKYGVQFQNKSKLDGDLAKLDIDGKTVYLLKPTTYMNRSGQAVKKVCSYFKIDFSNLLVVADDVYLEFGDIKVKDDSSSGGHKGLADIENALKTKAYSRVKVGVGNNKERDLSSYVLGRFLEKEVSELPHIITKAIEIIHSWLKHGAASAKGQATKIRKIEKRNVQDEKS